MSKSNKRQHTSEKSSPQSSSRVRTAQEKRERRNKIIVWAMVIFVVGGLILSMSPSPTAFTGVPY